MRYKNRYPDFEEAGYTAVKINTDGFKGRYRDSKLMEEKLRELGYDPDNYTCHHHEDCHTLLAVEKNIHNKFRHSGGISNLRKKAR